MKKILCLLNLHQWCYKKEKHPVTDHPENRANIYIKVRECRRCGKREQTNASTNTFGSCSADSTLKFVKHDTKKK